jgi:hypothetical protein
MCLLFACAIASIASAQTSPAPLSGAGADAGQTAPRKPAKEPPQTMVLAVALTGGSGDDLATARTDGSAAGLHTDADALVTYQLRGGGATFGMNARSVLRYVPSGAALTPIREQGGLEFSLAGSRSQLHVTEGVSYSPYFQFGAIPDASASPLAETAQSHGDFANSNLTAFESTTAVDWRRSVGRSVALSASYNLRSTTFNQPTLDQTIQSAGMGLTRRLTRFVSLRTGYMFQMTESPMTLSGFGQNHAINLGLDYSGPPADSKRTTVSFDSGWSATPRPEGMVFRPTANAALTRHIGRTWSARLGVNRGVQFLEGFTLPMLTNNVTASFGGALGRRTALSSSATYSTGAVGLTNGGNNGYTDSTAAIGLHFTVSRECGLDTQYFYSSHKFGQDIQLAPGLANELQRQGVRVGFTWRAPLLGHLKG